ncbi:class I SAM-dependent methyltransferase [Pseudomonas sp. Pdm06]|uniref:class I SAM-dependent methyltransferase n=1 Tax=Pseudomonas sp. Pdm06 TaxID=1790044 RepID=UPI0017830FEC|nr:class I SAM-dependent methyltransferase [Pseudomonas sp. Pdm06]MBD9466249.1 class I SAM-dependent methyltransferase [Pseudomonas sp. Pdm06]
MDPQRKDYLAAEAVYTGDSLRIGDEYVMHEWERPLIRRMVEDLKLTPDDRLLEIGFGMGISASILQEFGPASHTIVEPHPQVLDRAERWKGARTNIHLLPGYWQQLDTGPQRYSAIFFDPFADDMAAVDDENLRFLKFAAQSLLGDGGRLSLFCIRPLLPPEYQRVMFEHYRRVEISSVRVDPRDTANPTADLEGRMISVVLHK